MFQPLAQGPPIRRCAGSDFESVKDYLVFDGVKKKSYTAYSEVNFKCRSGYTMQGQYRIRCTPYNGWETVVDTIKCKSEQKSIYFYVKL